MLSLSRNNNWGSNADETRASRGPHSREIGGNILGDITQRRPIGQRWAKRLNVEVRNLLPGALTIT